MGLYETFQTDKNLETEGVWLLYGDAKILVAYAGTTNTKYKKVLEKLLKPHQTAIRTKTMDLARMQGILQEAFCRTIVLDWQTKVNGEWKRGIESGGEELLTFNYTNILNTFEALPALYTDVEEQASQYTLFQAEEDDSAVGN